MAKDGTDIISVLDNDNDDVFDSRNRPSRCSGIYIREVPGHNVGRDTAHLD
jgi:hypothetical protein